MICVPTLEVRGANAFILMLAFSLKVEIIRLMFLQKILKRMKLKEELKVQSFHQHIQSLKKFILV